MLKGKATAGIDELGETAFVYAFVRQRYACGTVRVRICETWDAWTGEQESVTHVVKVDRKGAK